MGVAPPSVNTHTHTLDLTHHKVCFRDPIRYTCQLCIPNTHMHAGPIPTLCISAKKTHNKGSRTRPIMSTLMPRSGIPVIAVELRCHATALIAYAKTKGQISCVATVQLICVFVFAAKIVQSLYFLNPKFQASWLYSLVCVGADQKPRKQVFS